MCISKERDVLFDKKQKFSITAKSVPLIEVDKESNKLKQWFNSFLPKGCNVTLAYLTSWLTYRDALIYHLSLNPVSNRSEIPLHWIS